MVVTSAQVTIGERHAWAGEECVTTDREANELDEEMKQFN